MTLATTTSANHGAGLFDPYRIAVLVPCFNEEAAIDKVVKDFRAALPAAAIFVFDNNSTDKTAEIARAHELLESGRNAEPVISSLLARVIGAL